MRSIKCTHTDWSQPHHFSFSGARMSRIEPIDLETFKFEEDDDLYGQPIKSEEEDSGREGTVPLKYTKPPIVGKKRAAARRAKSPNSIPRHRRNPQDADLEDRVLVRLIDSGMPWPYPPSHDMCLL